MIEAFHILKAAGLKAVQAPGSAKRIHWLAEVMNLAFEDRNQWLGDPDFVNIPLRWLLSKEHAKQLAAKINPSRHVPTGARPGQSEKPETTHFSVVDRDGNMVSNTYSLNGSFGSGKRIPGTGIILNNTMDDFTIGTGKNAYGLVQSKFNRLQAGARPLSSMTPIILLKGERALLATGSPGGPRIISTVFQFLIHYLMDSVSIATATEWPRFHAQAVPDILYLETGFSPDTRHLLSQMGYQLRTARAMGSLQTVEKSKRWVRAYSDTRRMGAKSLCH